MIIKETGNTKKRVTGFVKKIKGRKENSFFVLSSSSRKFSREKENLFVKDIAATTARFFFKKKDKKR